MSLQQFANSLGIIWRNEHRSRPTAFARHAFWQFRKLAFPKPVRLPLSRSVITDNEPGGIISLVNMLGVYDYNNMHLVKRVLQPGGVLVDVGANIGSYALIGSEDPAAHVISLEPNPTAYAKLLRNLAMNGRRNVTALNLGASDRSGVMHMSNDGASPKNHILGEGETAERTIEVPVDTVDGICARLERVPTIIKIDVEGHEPAVLRGSGNALRSVLVCIVENGERPEVTDLLRAHGFSGPLYYHHREGLLSSSPTRLPEDPVFVSERLMQAVPDLRLTPH